MIKISCQTKECQFEEEKAKQIVSIVKRAIFQHVQDGGNFKEGITITVAPDKDEKTFHVTVS